jgi:hypothetical protein
MIARAHAGHCMLHDAQADLVPVSIKPPYTEHAHRAVLHYQECLTAKWISVRCSNRNQRTAGHRGHAWLEVQPRPCATAAVSHLTSTSSRINALILFVYICECFLNACEPTTRLLTKFRKHTDSHQHVAIAISGSTNVHSQACAADMTEQEN